MCQNISVTQREIIYTSVTSYLATNMASGAKLFLELQLETTHFSKKLFLRNVFHLLLLVAKISYAITLRRQDVPHDVISASLWKRVLLSYVVHKLINTINLISRRFSALITLRGS